MELFFCSSIRRLLVSLTISNACVSTHFLTNAFSFWRYFWPNEHTTSALARHRLRHVRQACARRSAAFYPEVEFHKGAWKLLRAAGRCRGGCAWGSTNAFSVLDLQLQKKKTGENVPFLLPKSYDEDAFNMPSDVIMPEAVKADVQVKWSFRKRFPKNGLLRHAALKQGLLEKRCLGGLGWESLVHWTLFFMQKRLMRDWLRFI